MNFDSFIAILGMFGSGNNHVRIRISNLKQRRAFSLKCFLPGNVVADLNIKLLAASLSNKVDFIFQRKEDKEKFTVIKVGGRVGIRRDEFEDWMGQRDLERSMQ